MPECICHERYASQTGMTIKFDSNNTTNCKEVTWLLKNNVVESQNSESGFGIKEDHDQLVVCRVHGRGQ